MGIITRFHRNDDRTYEFSAWYATDDEAEMETCPPGRPYIMRKTGLSDEQVDSMITRLTRNGQMSLFTGDCMKMDQALRNLTSTSPYGGSSGPVIGELPRAMTSLPPAVQKKLWNFYALESVPGAESDPGTKSDAAQPAADSRPSDAAPDAAADAVPDTAPETAAPADSAAPAPEGSAAADSADGAASASSAEQAVPDVLDKDDLSDELIMPANTLYPFFYHYGMIDVVVAAAGVGARMNAGMPKQYMMLGSRSVLEHTVLRLLCWPLVRNVILVVSPEDEYIKSSLLTSLDRLRIVHGGKERSDSVLCGLKAVSSRWCMVHDAARPFFTCHDLENMLIQTMQVIEDCRLSGMSAEQTVCGSVLACRVADTIKHSQPVQPAPAPAADAADGAATATSAVAAGAAASALAVERTVDRSVLWRAQTPQLFLTADLIKAIESCNEQGLAITDEASAMENTGHRVLLVEGSSLNFKLTEPSDFVMAQALINICLPQQQS